MEHNKISQLLNDSTVSKFVTKKWVQVNDLSSGQCSVNKNIRFKTSALRSEGRITVAGDDDDKKRDEKLFFKNNVPFRSCI